MGRRLDGYCGSIEQSLMVVVMMSKFFVNVNRKKRSLSSDLKGSRRRNCEKKIVTVTEQVTHDIVVSWNKVKTKKDGLFKQTIYNLE